MIETDVFSEFKKVDYLGSNICTLFLVKSLTEASQISNRLNKRRIYESKGQFYPDFPTRAFKKEEGTLAIGELAKVLHDINGAAIWDYPGKAKYAFTSNEFFILIGLVDEIQVFSSKTGKYVKTITNPNLSRIHSLEFSHTNPNLVLCSSMGANKIVEINIQNNQINWLWNPLSNGYNHNKHDVYISLDQNDSQLIAQVHQNTHMQISKSLTESRIVKEFDITINKTKDEKLHEVLSWQNTFKPNWSGYDSREPDTFLSTSHSLGVAVTIQRNGDSKVLTDNLINPHGIIPTSSGYIITDTGRGKVLLLNQNKEITYIYNFSNLPVKDIFRKRKHEWLQHTYPLSRNLLVSVDSRRSHIVVWDNNNYQYSTYSYNPNWIIQSVSGFNGLLPPKLTFS